MNPKEKVLEVYRRLKLLYPEAKVALHFENPLQLLVATILSAQCTDERVNQVTKDLFLKYRSADDFAKADHSELMQDIRSISFPQKKAQYLKEACQIIVSDFGGEVPKNMADLLKLPGVSRKTANIVLNSAYGILEGIAVDTHVQRLAQRIGLTRQRDPEKIEMELMEIFPKEAWQDLTYLLQHHGRKTCLAKGPKCKDCEIKDLCDAYLSSS